MTFELMVVGTHPTNRRPTNKPGFMNLVFIAHKLTPVRTTAEVIRITAPEQECGSSTGGKCSTMPRRHGAFPDENDSNTEIGIDTPFHSLLRPWASDIRRKKHQGAQNEHKALVLYEPPDVGEVAMPRWHRAFGSDIDGNSRSAPS